MSSMTTREPSPVAISVREPRWSPVRVEDVGRVNRLMERRHLRRAADQALMSPAFLQPLDIEGQTGAAPPVDIRGDSDFSGMADDDWDANGAAPVEPITEPIPLAAIRDRLHNAPADRERTDDTAAAPPAVRPPSTPIGTWRPDLIERRRIRVDQRWYRTKAAIAGLAAAAIAVSSILVVKSGSEQATSVLPQASTSASPPPSRAAPSLSRAPSTQPSRLPAPPPPPPPPPPTAQSNPTPVWRNNDSWSPSPASPSKKPQIDVTRAPLSATPPPPPPPGTNSATPGDGRRRGFFG